MKPQVYNQPNTERGELNRTSDLFFQQPNDKKENKGYGNSYRVREM